jgi:hypothetical protein
VVLTPFVVVRILTADSRMLARSLCVSTHDMVHRNGRRRTILVCSTILVCLLVSRPVAVCEKICLSW